VLFRSETAVNFIQDASQHLDKHFLNSRQYLDCNDYVNKKINLKKKQFNKSLEIEDI
jgi:hypothetical protein